MIQLKKFVFNMFGENTYVIWDDESKECAIIDPGCYEKHEELELQNFIMDENLIVKYLINTHCHIDHIFGCRFVKDKFNPTYLASEKDLPLLQNINVQVKMIGLGSFTPILPDQYLTAETMLKLGNSELKFLFTPGHSPGEYCIYLPDEKICITGDVLFYDSIGRTDILGGDYDMLMESIQQKLLTLPNDTTIYPGHGEKSTIFRERTKNPFLNELS